MFWRRSDERVLDEVLTWYDVRESRVLNETEATAFEAGQFAFLGRRRSEILRDVVRELRVSGFNARDILSLILLIVDLITVIGDSVKQIVDRIKQARGK